MKSVIRDRNCIGFIVNCAKGFKAVGENGEEIGMFSGETAAVKAVYSLASRIGVLSTWQQGRIPPRRDGG
jgi:hypothetical protein